MIRTAALIAGLAAPAAAADFEFCWEGANGYRVDGTMTVPDDALSKPVVTETDVTAFEITGTLNGAPLGRWSLTDLTPTTSWNLNFSPAEMAFQTGGHSATAQGQEWNANGRVNDCGTAGFGFNSGSGGQDVCVDGTYRFASSVNQATPFPVFPLGAGGTCSGIPLIGSLAPLPRTAS